MQFNSISELGHYLKTTPNARGAGCHSGMWVIEDTNGMTRGEAIELAIAGGCWEEGARDLKAVNIQGAQTPVFVNRISSGVSGFAPLVPNALMNLPNSMLCFNQQSQKKPIIKIAVNSALAHKIEPHQALNRGRAILSCVESLENAGYQIEIWAIDRVTNGKKKPLLSIIDTCIKNTNEVLQLTSVAFALCSAFWTRRLGMHAMEKDGRLNSMTNKNYGLVFNDRPSGFDVYLPCIQDQAIYDTYDRALDNINIWINQQLGEL